MSQFANTEPAVLLALTLVFVAIGTIFTALILKFAMWLFFSESTSFLRIWMTAILSALCTMALVFLTDSVHLLEDRALTLDAILFNIAGFIFFSALLAALVPNAEGESISVFKWMGAYILLGVLIFVVVFAVTFALTFAARMV